jgi:OmpA-OmpF porin, OOP family
VLDTLYASSLATLKRFDLGNFAGSLGESEQSVSRGIESSVATILSGLSRKTTDSNTLQQVVDLASKAPGEISASAVTPSTLTDANSPLLSGGKRLLALVFGGGENAVLNAVSRGSNLRTATASTLLAFAGQAVLGLIGKGVRDDGLTAGGLSGLLQRESTTFRGAVPAGFNELFSTAPAASAAGFAPIVAQTVRKERSKWPWLLGVLLALLVLIALWWSVTRHHAAPIPAVPAAGNLGSFVPRQLADGTTLNVPENGIEARLLAFIQDSSRAPDKTTWFDFDRLLFATGSATLEPQSQEQLSNIAAILKAYPNVQIKIGGYTDNTGAADQNQKLSQDRADNVMAELVQLGVAQDRLSAQGYGEDHPVADNSTDAGRALNRRISLLVTQK